MKSDRNNELDRLTSKMIDGKLSENEAASLSDLLSTSTEAVARYQELMDNHEALCAIYPGQVYRDGIDSQPDISVFLPDENPTKADSSSSLISLRRLTLAAAALFAVGLLGYLLGLGSEVTVANIDKSGVTTVALPDEQTIAGHATLRRSVDLEWAKSATAYRDGDVILNGPLKFAAGLAEVDFFCGATLIIEGPAELEIESDWSVKVIAGRLRANVPPAARGFVVKTLESEIIDLGTEFALDVGIDRIRVEVIDGEVELRGGRHDGEHLLTGEQRILQGTDIDDNFDALSTLDDLRNRRSDAASQRIADWQSSVNTLANDERLVAYFPMSASDSDRSVSNAARTGRSLDGILIGPVARTNGRFGVGTSGLEFDRPGSRMRMRIDHEFSAFTFACWAKFDSLDQVYNSILMADGYETGEPHWQIRNDGRLMFSVMVDDTQSSRHYSKLDQGFVDSAGLARVYYSEPFWDASQSGKWFHLAVVYDPVKRQVTQYVDGKRNSSEPIPDKFFIDRLKLGPSEIGNWGQPFRKTPWFAVRNLNGAIDELAVFDAALNDAEIETLYTNGKPLGY
ncbi:LamG-like jellyroll fold domain-containing protein [Planctomycetes bacterium K23_9]|uniref:FecR protein n=1 Tax=Stieleria marina TaxID=1930275 RepID=A0A517NU50_9BACT|nr:FecR protein [Planctomycetes bacterium K23_9]